MYSLPPLPYTYNALEPYIDTLTMEIHYTKHHQGYVNGLNAALEKHPELQKKSLEQLLSSLETLPEDVRTAIRNNGGGHFNHSLFWQWMTNKGGGEPKGKLGEAITKKFGSFAAYQELFNNAAKTRFGSGWAWLCLDKNGNLVVTSTANQDTPLAQDMKPIMGLDVWEHAYYLKYHNRRPDYITSWWHVVNWEFIEDHYRTII